MKRIEVWVWDNGGMDQDKQIGKPRTPKLTTAGFCPSIPHSPQGVLSNRPTTQESLPCCIPSADLFKEGAAKKED